MMQVSEHGTSRTFWIAPRPRAALGVRQFIAALIYFGLRHAPCRFGLRYVSCRFFIPTRLVSLTSTDSRTSLHSRIEDVSNTLSAIYSSTLNICPYDNLLQKHMHQKKNQKDNKEIKNENNSLLPIYLEITNLYQGWSKPLYVRENHC